MRKSPDGDLVGVGFDAPGQAAVYFGGRRVARVRREDDGRWTVARRGGPTLDTLDAVLDWLCTPPAAPLPLDLTLSKDPQ